MSVRSRDVDEAREVGSAIYHPHGVQVFGDRGDFEMRLDAARIGPLTLGWIDYDTEVRIETGELGNAYQVNIPFAGTLDTGSGPERTLATERRAAVYRLDRNSYLRGWGNGARILGLKIDRLELEDQLAGMIDRPVTSPIEFELSMNLGTKHGAQWLDVVKVLAAHLTDSDSLVRHPLLAAPLAQSVMAGLLLASEHNYSTDLSRTPARTRGSVVDDAIDFITANADKPLTVDDIARHVGIGPRGLQQSFHAARGISPMRYLRNIRLERAHQELLVSEPRAGAVSDIAHRWGFVHLGRFAEQYHQTYGEHPSVTLHQ